MEFGEWFDDNRQELSLEFEEQEGDSIEGLDWEDFLLDKYEGYLFESQGG